VRECKRVLAVFLEARCVSWDAFIGLDRMPVEVGLLFRAGEPTVAPTDLIRENGNGTLASQSHDRCHTMLHLAVRRAWLWCCDAVVGIGSGVASRSSVSVSVLVWLG
jgi:hypothetical protein